MKKLYFFLVAMICAFAVNATDYYLIGGFNGWTLKDAACKFTASTTEGVYTLNYNGTLTSGFKINDGTWSNNAINFGSNGSKLVEGTAYAYGVGGSTGDIAMDGAIANPTLTLDINAGTLLIEGQSAEVEITYVIHGTLASTTWADTNLTKTADGLWTAAGVVVSNTAAEFGIKELSNGSQSAWYGVAEAVTVSGDAVLDLVTSYTQNIKIAAGTYDFSLDVANQKLTITGNGDTPTPPTPPTPGTPEFYLVGINGSWDFTAANKMAEADGVYTLDNVEITTVGGFKVATEGWGEQYGGSEITISDDSLTATLVDAPGEGTDAKYTITGTYNVKFVYATKVVTFTKVGDAPTPPTPGTPEFYLVGINGAWTFTDANKMAEADGVYTLDNVNLTDEGGFKVATEGWGEQYGGADVTISDDSLTATLEDAPGEGTDAKYTITGVYNVKFVYATKVITFTKVSDTPVPSYPEKLYLTGDANNCAWGLAAATATGVDGVYTYNDVNINDASEGYGWFSFSEVVDTEIPVNWEMINAAPRYGAPEADVVIENGQTYDVIKDLSGDPNSWKAEAGTYNLVLNLGTMKLQIQRTTGIEGVAADNTEAVYYNLQGVRVANPANGLYIVVRGNKVAKELVK